MKYDSGNKPKERVIGVMHFQDLSDGDDYTLNLDRIRGGYGLSTPLFIDDGQHIKATVSKGKEYKWFAGVRARWEF